jgi:PKD repeat protein
MKADKIKLKIIFYFWAVILLIVTALLPLGMSNFILPPEGGGMVHCDPQFSENIRRPVPTTNVGIVWYSHDQPGGELWGTWGNGIVGNGKIAATSFDNRLNKNNLNIYDYYGNRIWSSGHLLNFTATASTPMVDIYNRVIACDNKTIILVNASNLSHVYVQWQENFTLPSVLHDFPTVPVCPTIVENKTIVLPVSSGPLFAFNAQNGTKIAELKLGQNETIDPYWGIPEMNWTNYKIIRINYFFHSICPYRYNTSSGLVEWNSTVPYGVMPFRFHIFLDNDMMYFADENNVAAYEKEGFLHWNLIAYNPIDNPGIFTGEGYFSSINSVSAKGNRIFVNTQYKKQGTIPFNNTIGRLYAFDVNPDAINESDRLKEKWNFTYFGSSQASPTVINDTVYFDGYNNTLNKENRDPHIYAIYTTNGTLKWKVRYQNITWFSFAKDPRGGFWYEDCDQVSGNNKTGGNKLVRFYEENGTEMSGQEIDMKTLLNDTLDVLPSSDMTTCGTETNPIMLISANHQWFQEGKWVVAINLSNNRMLWNVSIPSLTNLNLNYANGQYTILTENNESRILFGTWLGGVIAIGNYPNCWFDNISSKPWDSYLDYNNYNDSVNISFSIKSSVLQDHIWVKAMLISQDYPVLRLYKTEKDYTITSSGIQDNLTITLPSSAPKGMYDLRVYLYNSSGMFVRKLLLLPDFMDNGIFTNDTNLTEYYMYPPNDPPETPRNISGDTELVTYEKATYTTNTTDSNNDSIYYQWKYQTKYFGVPFTYYTMWIAGGPHASGESCQKEIRWSNTGTYNIWVRAKDNIFNPNVMSNWSENLTINVQSSGGGSQSWNNELLDDFSSTVLTINQQTSCNGFAQGIMMEPATRGSLNWTWDFGDGNVSYGENVTHSYSQVGNYTVNLSIHDDDNNFLNCSENITVLILNPVFSTGGDVQPEKTVHFTDTSTGFYQIVNWTWDFDDGNISYARNVSHMFTTTGVYNVTLTVRDIENNTYANTQPIYVELVAPELIQVIDDRDPIDLGFPMTIAVDLFDNQSLVRDIHVNITYPNNTSQNFTMINNISSPYDYTYTFNGTWQAGVYNYSIWAVDYANNTNFTTGFNFTVSAEANITVSTTKNNYTDNEYINLTDPPGSPSPSLGYELLDDGAVLHLWNHYDSYYFNTSSGIQLTNHKDEYWTKNILILGYYNNDQWNLLYRTDELTGFSRSIETDTINYMNVTLWKDLSYAGYQFRLALRYHLGVNDNDLTVIPSIKNTGENTIPYVLGFGWELKDIQINTTSNGDYIMVDQNSYLLNQTLDNSYTSLNDSVFYLMENITDSQTQSLYLRWNPVLDYKLLVKSRAGQQNAPVTLFIRVGTLAAGQQKSTSLQWYDASQETYYFDAFDANETWENDPELMTDETEETFASTRTDTTVELCNGNTCEGDNLGTIQKVELRVNGYYEGKDGGNITLRPIFGKTDGENYTFVAPERPEWSQWFDITNDDSRGSGGLLQWSWSEVNKLDCDVEASVGAETTLSCAIVQLRVTYNTAPSVSNPYPPHGTNGISLQPQLNITVSDPNSDTMNVTWYTNSTPSLLALHPNANGSITELQRYPTSQNANYKCVDETIVNDNDYVYWSGTSWKKDTYNLANRGAVSGVIHSVTVYARCNRAGFGMDPSVPNEGKIVIRSSGSYYYGNEFAPTSTFTYYSHTWLVNPATGNAWNWSAIDALEAGISFIGNEGGSSKCSQVYVVVNYTNPNTWLQFGQNISVSNGVYRQRFLNASVNGQWWYWKVKADDGTLSTWSSVFKFYTGYQSKIENTGETNIKGYLLMQVQYYNETTENWIVDNDTVNETTPRTINSCSQLALDTIFNGKIRVSNLQHGTGTYRVYAAFRDPEGNILKTNNGAELKAWWQFSKT